MGIKCPKCDYERQPGEQAPANECPKCGVIYTKVMGPRTPASGPKVPPKAVPQAAVPVAATHPRSHLVVVAVVALVVGYFGGREHMKYELAQVFVGAADSFAQGLQDLGGSLGGGSATVKETKRKEPAPAADPPDLPVKAESPIGVRLVEKGFADYDYSDAVTFTIDFHNSGERDVTAFRGVVHFQDLLGGTIKKVRVTIDDLVPAGQTFRWEGQMDYNQFIDSDRKLRVTEQEKLVVDFQIDAVLYADGERVEF